MVKKAARKRASSREESWGATLPADAVAAVQRLAPLPPGMILPWYSTNGTVPAGWALCDGRLWRGSDDNYYRVPNLIEKFIRGSTEAMDANTAEADVPGSDTHRHGAATNGRVNPYMTHSGIRPRRPIQRNHYGAHEHVVRMESNVPRHWNVMYIIRLP